MAKTLIQLCNDVGKNLRRSTGTTYTTLDQNQDVVLIVQMINEAKRMVEDNWNSDVLVQSITFNSVADQREYDTSSLAVVTSDPVVTTERSRIKRTNTGRLQFWDVTSGNEGRMQERSREFADHVEVVTSQSVAIPSLVTIYKNGVGLTVKFPYPPTGVRNYKFNAIIPQDELAATGTVLTVPWIPVVLAATALTIEERGEELGMDATRWWEQYENAFGNHVAQDSNESDFQLIPDTFDYFERGI